MNHRDPLDTALDVVYDLRAALAFELSDLGRLAESGKLEDHRLTIVRQQAARMGSAINGDTASAYRQLAPGDSADHVERALAEVEALQQVFAFEADILTAHATSSDLNDTERTALADQIERMRSASCGQVRASNSRVMQAALVAAGASPTLTREEWLRENTSLSAAAHS